MNRTLSLCVLWIFTCLLVGGCHGVPGLSRSPMCNCSTDCKLPKDTNDQEQSGSMTMKHYQRNSSACASLLLEGSREHFPENFSLSPYLYVQQGTYKQTAFNVSLPQDSWSFLRFRAQQNGNEAKINYCRDFARDEEVKSDWFFDCLWSDSRYENLTYNFEVMIHQYNKKAYKKFTFRVPDSKRIATNIKNSEVLLYIDVSVPTKMILHFSPLPGITKYSVSKLDKDNALLESQEITVTPRDESSTVQDAQIRFDTPASGSPYKFTITPIHESCEDGCYMSESPFVEVVEQYDLAHLVIILPLLGCVIIFGLALLYFKMRIIKAQAALKNSKLTVLLIYQSTHKLHTTVVDKLAAYLEGEGIRVLLDRRDIAKTTHKDPYNWYNSALDEADVILVLSSLKCCPSDVVGIHRKVDALALNQLKDAITQKKKHCAKVLLPYCKLSDIPEEAAHFKFFKLPSEHRDLLTFVRGGDSVTRLLQMRAADKDAGMRLEEFKLAVSAAVSGLAGHAAVAAPEGDSLTMSGVANGVAKYFKTEDGEMERLVSVELDDPPEEQTPRKNLYPQFHTLDLYADDPTPVIHNSRPPGGNKFTLDGMNL